MIKNYKKIIAMFPPHSEWKLVSFLFVLMIAAILEMAGVGLIMPLIIMIDKPEIIHQHQLLSTLYTLSNADSTRHFILFCSIFLIIFYAIKNVYEGIIIYWHSHFLAKSESFISTKLLDTYLFMPYDKYLNTNHSRMTNNINVEVTELFAHFIKPLFITVTDSLIVISILTLLIFTSPMATLSGILIILLSGMLFYLPVRKNLYKLGKIRHTNREKMTQWINQSLGSMKEIVVMEKRDFFRNSFNKHSNETIKTTTFYETVTQLPKLIIEGIGIITLLTVTIVVLYSEENSMPTLSLFAMAAFRLMPAMHRIANCVAKLRYYSVSLNLIYDDLTQIKSNTISKDNKELCFSSGISINNLTYSYPETKKPVLKNISLKVSKGSSIGIIGQSGAGKSTFVDIILGLLNPTEGNIIIDDINLSQCLHSWRSHISYIPQVIYLIDDTIRRNIAIGRNDTEINEEKIWQSLEQAELADMVRNLPEGLETKVGERGVKLSGGQRQRIGIARAFYNEPLVLILDEATTGLDPKTENSICETLKKMKHRLTLIAISHQPALTAVADKVYMLENGTIKEFTDTQ